VTPHDGCRVSPFGHPRIKACLAAPRGLSQLTTSFIGSRRQGIHRWLFVAWKNKDARARYAILKGRETNQLQHSSIRARPFGAGSQERPRRRPGTRQGPGRRTGDGTLGHSLETEERTDGISLEPLGDPKIYNRGTSSRPSSQYINWVVSPRRSTNADLGERNSLERR
jgi:hypothetical protein